MSYTINPIQLQQTLSMVGNLQVEGTGVFGTPTQGVLSVQGSAYTSSATFNRPADSNIYAAGDIIGPATGSTAIQSFAGIGPTGGGDVFITTAILEIDIAAIPSGMTAFTLYLYSATAPSAFGDNTPYNLPAGDRSVFLQPVSLGAPVDFGDTVIGLSAQINQQITVPSNGTLYGYLVTAGSYTPSASSTFKVTLKSIGI